MTEEVAEVPINTIETEPTLTQESQEPEVTAEVVEPLSEKPKRKSRKTKEEAVEAPAVKRKSAKKKAEKVEIIPVEVEEVHHDTPSEPLPVADEPSFREVQKSMAELQSEFRRLRREQKTTHYKKMLQGKI